MEFDIGTLIYIVITILAVILGAKGKKKKPGTGDFSHDEEASGGFFSRFEEQLGGLVNQGVGVENSGYDDVDDELAEVKPASEPANYKQTNLDDYKARMSGGKPDPDSPYRNFEGEYNPDEEENMDLTRMEANRSTDDHSILDIIEIDALTNPNYSELIEEFDLGEAIIYSEIINRKEY